MSALELLDAAVPVERERWLELWSEWPDREVSAHPDYVRLFARPVDRVLCAASRHAEGGVLYPLIVRPLSEEPWCDAGAVECDATTPYGYGGPFAWGTTSPEQFWDEFDHWASRASVVASFARLSLFADQLLPFRGEIAERAPNVVRSLDLDDESLWMDYEHKVRKNVKKAERAGLDVLIDRHGERLDDFLAIYHSTMDRREAAGAYYFPRSFFETLIHDLKGQFCFFHVARDGVVVSTELVLVSERHIYSFLGGTRADAFALRPNDLLKQAVARWGRAEGKSSFVLGGGYRADDGIFRYKASFAPNGIVPFRVGTRIHAPQAYAALVRRRTDWEADQGRCWAPDPEFFPAYRGGATRELSNNPSER